MKILKWISVVTLVLILGVTGYFIYDLKKSAKEQLNVLQYHHAVLQQHHEVLSYLTK